MKQETMIREKLKNELRVLRRLDDSFWQRGYAKMENQLIKKVKELIYEAKNENPKR